MVQYSINDIAHRKRIAATMSEEVDSALVTQPRTGGRMPELDVGALRKNLTARQFRVVGSSGR